MGWVLGLGSGGCSLSGTEGSLRLSRRGAVHPAATFVQADVRRFVFSSTAAVYGMPDHDPILESAPLQPISPCGESKVRAGPATRPGWWPTQRASG
ncbi:MAG: GDP-mannose 4,6-dehydratase [Chloroflexi bacterium]|nr:GDP-mannose 4,6-dehydratase [Chloroflexota bacterium]